MHDKQKTCAHPYMSKCSLLRIDFLSTSYHFITLFYLGDSITGAFTIVCKGLKGNILDLETRSSVCLIILHVLVFVCVLWTSCSLLLSSGYPRLKHWYFRHPSRSVLRLLPDCPVIRACRRNMISLIADDSQWNRLPIQKAKRGWLVQGRNHWLVSLRVASRPDRSFSIGKVLMVAYARRRLTCLARVSSGDSRPQKVWDIMHVYVPMVHVSLDLTMWKEA